MVGPISMTNFIIGLCVCVHHFILLIYHSYKTLYCFTKSEAASIQKLSILLILTNFISVTNLTFTTWDWYPINWSCHWIMVIGSILYLSAKLILYILISERLFFIFSDSEISFKSFYIWLSRIILLIYWCFMTLLILTVGSGFRGELNCELDLPFQLLSGMALGDIIISYTISSIFARRLLLLNLKLSAMRTPMELKMERSKSKTLTSKSGATSNMESTNNFTIDTPRCSVAGTGSRPVTPRKDAGIVRKNGGSPPVTPIGITEDIMIQEMYDIDTHDVTWTIVTKSTLLSLIALITTPLSLVLLVFFGVFGYTFVTMDSAVNCWCVVLMFNPYKPLYKCLCKRMEVCMGIKCLRCWSCTCCCCCGNKINDIPQLRMNVATVSEKTHSVQTGSTATGQSSKEEGNDGKRDKDVTLTIPNSVPTFQSSGESNNPMIDEPEKEMTPEMNDEENSGSTAL